MVFESLVVDILNRYLKPYVKRLDTSQLKVGVWKGHASLDKLELKENLFAEADLDVPLKIVRSFIGKLEMKIPWKRLTKDPLIITIDEMYVILGPNIETEYDPEAALTRERKEKEKKIEQFKESLKSKKKLEKESKKSKKKEKDSEKPDSFVEKLAVHLTKNLQVLVRDIHVRYEDSLTRPGTTLAAGATLHSLEIKSTDDKWMPTVVRETATVIYKLLELNCLGVYANSYDQSMAKLDTQTMIDEMRNSIARPAVSLPPSNAYLLAPVTATAKLKMNVKIDGDLSMPQLVGGIDAGDILFSLQQDQLQNVLILVDYFERYKLKRNYLKYKPSLSLREDRKGWWRYAITAVLEEDVKRRTRMWSWKHMKQHRKLCIKYQTKYYEKLHSVSVSSSLKEELQRLEDSLDWFNIMVYRKAAIKKKGASRPSTLPDPPRSSIAPLTTPSIPTSSITSTGEQRKAVFSSGSKEAKREEKARKEEQKAIAAARKEEEKLAKKASKKEKTSGKVFFSKLKSKMSRSKAKERVETAVAVSAADQEREGDKWELVGEEGDSLSEVVDVLEEGEEELDKAREQLYKDIGYVENEELKYPKEYIGHEIHLNVNSLTLELVGKKSHVGQLVTEKIAVDLYHRPATNAVSMSASVRSMIMSGISPEGGTGQKPTLVTSLVGGAKEAREDLVNLQLEISPIERPDMDVTVKAALRPIQITYDFATVNGLIEMFKPPKLIHFQELTQAASASWEELKSQTSASLKKAVRDRKQIELDITLQSPFLVVPEKGVYTPESHLIIADLGKLTVYGHTSENKSATIKTRTDALEKFYDPFTIKLDGMQVMVAKPGEDWWSAMRAEGSSPLHILDPTGFEIVLLKSIVASDAYLPSLRVEGTLPGFEVKISDTKLTSLIKVGGSLEKPPALITITDAYDSLPTLPTERLALDDVTEVVDTGAIALISTVSSSLFLEGEEEEEEVEQGGGVSPRSSLTPIGEGKGEEDATARHVFTDVSINLTIKQLALKLTKTEKERKKEIQKPLLDVLVREIKADVVDRKWDTQGSVSMGEVDVLDYITRDSSGNPTYLLKTEALSDGNFISLRFVTITRVGMDFAAKYTGLQDTVSAQLSLIKINLNRTTLAAILQYVAGVLPAMKQSPEQTPSLPPAAVVREEEAVDNHVELSVGPGAQVENLNPNDVTGGVPKKLLDLHFDVKFDGINLSLLEKQTEIVHTGVTGFQVNGRAKVDKITVDVKINDVKVVDTTVSNAQTVCVISKADQSKDILSLSVVQYNHPSYERDPDSMQWVDTALKAKMGRINVNADTNFISSVLEFVKNLNINKDLFQSAAVATAETATVTANAIAESAKTAHRLRLDVLFHAPSVLIPYSSAEEQGGIHINLGEFRLSNRYMHARELEGKVTDTVSILSAQTILDCIDIDISSVQVYRKWRSSACSLQDQSDGSELRSTILEPIKFTAHIRRNVSQPSEAYPNVDILVNLDSILFHLHENDIQAFLSIGEVAMKMAATMMPPAPPSPRPGTLEAAKPRSHTLQMAKAKRTSKRFSGFGTTTRSRATTAAARWQKAARLKRFKTVDGKEVTDVRVTATLNSLNLKFTTADAPLFNFTLSDLNAKIDVFKTKLNVSASVDSLSLIDISTASAHSKVISLAEHSDRVSSVDLSVSLDKGLSPLAPLGSVSTHIAQIQLVILTPFVLKIVKFAQRLKFDYDPKMLQNASKAAYDGATAVSSMTHDKYFKVELTMQAPVLILPVSEHSDQGFMIDLGSLAIQNTILVPDQSQVRVGIDAYGIKLDSFKVSRVLLDSSRTGSPVVAERVLLQPFHMLLALERNLSSWYTKVPTLAVNLTMGELLIFLGQEDLEQFFKFGMAIAEEVKPVIPSKPAPSQATPSEQVGTTDLPTITEAPVEEGGGGEKEEEVFEKFRVMSNLPQFELKLFKGEPHLSKDNAVSKTLSKCEDYSLASLQLVTMELKVHVSSRTEVEVQASMKDIALCDLRQEAKKKNTGNRIVQHYTSNPLKAFTGKIEKPLINISYILTLDQEHNVIVGLQNLLVLSDIEFLSLIGNYFKGIFDPKALPQSTSDPSADTELEDTLKQKSSKINISSSKINEAVAAKEKSLEAVKEEEEVVASAPKPFPRIKLQASISNFRVAIVEDVYTEQPQALSLNLTSCHTHLQLSEQHKHASLSLSELGIATSSFFDLDNTTSWILLPCNIQLSMMGPADKPAMEINGFADPISLTLSPAVVRLIIHAVQTLIPPKEVKVEEAPRDLWVKQVVSCQKFWFLENVVNLHKTLPAQAPSTQPKGEVLTFTIEAVEILLEGESTSNSHAFPVLALNTSAVVQLFEWTGQLSATAEAHVEATYYNKAVSVWEPVLETLERADGKQELWDLQLKAEKAPPKAVLIAEGDLNPRPDFSLELSSKSALQLTLTKTSIQLIKSLAESYSKEYGKQVEGSVKVQSLTGAPYTVINKLGKDTSLFVQPGSSLKIIGDMDFAKLDNDEKVDLKFLKVRKRRSHASLIGMMQSAESTIDIAVGKSFMPLKKIPVDTPGLFYYTLLPKKDFDATMSTFGLVIDVAVTGTKKTIVVRSPIQFKNHLQYDIDILCLAPTKNAEDELLTVVKPEQVFQVPIDVAQTHTFYVRPTGFGFTPVGNRISWQQRKDSQHMELKCVMTEDDSVCFFSQVVFRVERYKSKRNVMVEDYPHHVFHIYPPLIVQNLLPYQIFIEAMDYGCPSRSMEPGQSLHIHELDLGRSPDIRVSVIQDKAVGLKGRFTLDKKQPEYATFATTSSGSSAPTQLTLHSEDLGYLKSAIYCSLWMINKTGLTLEYKEGSKITKHPHDKDMVLLSTSSNKSKIQLRARTLNNTYTDWTKSFPVNAVGTGGNFTAKLGENMYRFGVETSLSRFTLTKLVMVTPYYLLVNKTKDVLKVHEKFNPGLLTPIPPGEVVPFWTLNNSELMVLVAGEHGKASCSPPFSFKKPDNTVLQFDNSNEVLAVCLEVQETESANVITFSPYYHGCVPLLVINHFPDLSLRFAQNIKGTVITHTLSARESLYFRWDDPLGKKMIRWNFPAATQVHNRKPIDISKLAEGRFNMTFDPGTTAGVDSVTSYAVKRTGDSWIEVDESLSEQLLPADDEESDEISVDSSISGSELSIGSSINTLSSSTASNGNYRGYWKSFMDGLQRVLIFTPDEGVLMKIHAANSFSLPLFEAALNFRAIGLSLVDNDRKRELAYVSVSPSGVLWQLDKGKKKRIWKTLNNSVIHILEQAYQEKRKDIKVKDLTVNLETMEMFSPLKGKLRRTHYDGLHFKFTMTEQDYAIQAKIGHVQVDNQLPFSVYPQVLYPLPPPPTVASTAEPKPFVEASIILKKPDQTNVTHFKYVHVLVQKISLNVDLGFILSLVDFFSVGDQDALLEAEYVRSDMEYAEKSLMKTVVPEMADDISSTRIFFDVLHLAPIKINLSFNIRSVGKNKGSNEISVGDRFLHLFLDSIGVILTSVQDTEMKLSLFHLEHQPQTGKGLTKLLVKHYSRQALFELHTLIFGLDVIGNPVSVVRGVVFGAKDLFYEPFKGSVLGPEEFLEGLGFGLRSFFGAGVVGGITGAGARITGAFGDVFAKLTFDDEFIEQRQQTKTKPPKMGWKLGGFAKNVLEGVTGVVTQPVKGLQKEGAVGLLKGTGKGLVGLVVRPTGGLVDLASGTLDFVTRKTKIGNIEISDVRPPRFIGRDGVIKPYSSQSAVGTALLLSVDEGNYVESDYYSGHLQVQNKPVHFLVVTDRRLLLIERKILTEGWKSFQDVEFRMLESPVEIKDVTILINYTKQYKDRKFRSMSFRTEDVAEEIGQLINHSYIAYLKEQ